MGSSDSMLLAIALVAVVVSAIGAGFTYSAFTGFATATGGVNLSVETVASINFTNVSVNWSSGRVDIGAANATLNTATGTVTNGNWTAVTSGLIIQNLGNTNTTLNLSFGKTAATFVGGTSPLYQYNVTNQEANSCLNTSGGTNETTLNLSIWKNTNTAAPGDFVCGMFQFKDAADTIEIDIRLVVPSDAITGVLGDTVTATANACTLSAGACT